MGRGGAQPGTPTRPGTAPFLRSSLSPLSSPAARAAALPGLRCGAAGEGLPAVPELRGGSSLRRLRRAGGGSQRYGGGPLGLSAPRRGADLPVTHRGARLGCRRGGRRERAPARVDGAPRSSPGRDGDCVRGMRKSHARGREGRPRHLRSLSRPRTAAKELSPHRPRRGVNAREAVELPLGVTGLSAHRRAAPSCLLTSSPRLRARRWGSPSMPTRCLPQVLRN